MVETVTTIADQVFSEIRKAIVGGEIPQGSKISEPELARRFGISRGPLREAMRRLESASLVERRPNVGARVITLSNEQLLEIFHVREALEGMAARLAARNMLDTEIAALRALVADHQRQAERDDGKSYIQREGDLDFHYRIVDGSHNSRLKALLCDDLYYLVRMYRLQFGMASPRARRALGEHSHIIEAIEGGDGELAEILMRRHIRASRKNLERRLSEERSIPNDAMDAFTQAASA
jgi:DNA-binding GntR family transcriptional regulator